MVDLQFLFDPKQMKIERRTMGARISCIICRVGTPVCLSVEDREQEVTASVRPPKISFPVCLAHAELVESYIRRKLFYPSAEDYTPKAPDDSLPFQPKLL